MTGTGYIFYMKSKRFYLLPALVAILCWSSLATLGTWVIHLPPFFILTFCFGAGAILGFGKPREMFPGLKFSLMGGLGYFIYHFCLFYSFRLAPAIEANLINYLWPGLLMVLTPFFFPQEKLRWHHFLILSLGFLGVFILLGADAQFKSQDHFGHGLALGAAFSWPIFSLMKKSWGPLPLRSVAGFSLIASLFCGLTHLWLGPWVVLEPRSLAVLILMGFGPFGISFYAWDLALKEGDPKVVGALSFITPLLSTLGLVLFTGVDFTWRIWLAMVLIIGGALLGVLDFLPRRNLIK
jgi:drug/metabolite transporter (DMT)-like permease